MKALVVFVELVGEGGGGGRCHMDGLSGQRGCRLTVMALLFLLEEYVTGNRASCGVLILLAHSQTCIVEGGHSR